MRPLPKDLALGIPIVGFTGINGAGKTTLAVQSAICDMAAGRDVYSTVPIRSEYGWSKPIRSMRELLTLHDATILLDDVSVIFSSRSTGSLPPEVVALLDTLRHKHLTVRWTAPSWMRCDNLLRGVTQAVVNVMPLFRVRDGSPWPRPRLVLAGLMDTSSGKLDETPTRVMRRRVYVQSKLAAFGAYDSHADTPLLGRHLQGGKCVDCGGSQPIEKCTPDRHSELGLPWIPRALPVFRDLDATVPTTDETPA